MFRGNILDLIEAEMIEKNLKGFGCCAIQTLVVNCFTSDSPDGQRRRTLQPVRGAGYEPILLNRANTETQFTACSLFEVRRREVKKCGVVRRGKTQHAAPGLHPNQQTITIMAVRGKLDKKTTRRHSVFDLATGHPRP